MNQKSGQEPAFYNEKLKLLSEFSCNWKYEDHEEKQHIEKSK